MSPCGVLSLINLSSVFLYILVLSCCLGSSLCTDKGHRADSTRRSSSTSSGNKSEASFGLSVEQGRLICAEYGELLNISCSVRASNDKTVNSWSISWLSEGASLSNLRETITLTNNSVKTSGFSVLVDWSSNEKVFTCLAKSSGTESRDGQQILNESVVVRLNPQPVNITGARFIETIRGQIVEVFWKPIERNQSVIYTLKYCLDYTEDDLGPICPNYSILESQCQFRERDYYGVPATAGMTCNASLSYEHTAPLSVPHVLNVVSNRSGCQSQGSTRNFELARFAEPNIDLLVMIPHPVEDVQILVTSQRIVRLSWSYPSLLGLREYSVEYNCSNNNITSLGISSKTHINLSSKALYSYRPYALCRFCVKARFQIHHGGSDAFSEPVCRETRLHEEIPSDAPKITCRGEGCETTSDDVARNVTVTWTLPPRESWNGVLENVTVVYRRSNNRSKDMEVSETNITKGATVLRGLEKDSSYIVAMTACNKEGCSRQGNGMAISAQPPKRALSLAKASAGKDRRLPWALGVGVFLALLVLGLIIAAIVIKMKRRDERDTREPLPDLQAPEDYDNPDTRTNEYVNLEDKRQGQENVASDV